MYFPAIGLSGHISPYGGTASLHSPPLPSADPPAVPLRSCTPHDPLSSTYSVEDILRIILKGRKNWKTLKDQSEAVWPPYLEATMLKALHEYQPDHSRETRMLGRYPMRNRFISDYIHKTTGKYRSAKQVGSRLQQLRDTEKGRELIDALTGCYHTRMDTGTNNARISVCRPSSAHSSSTSPSPTISCDGSSSSSSASPDTPTTPVMSRFPPPRARQPPEARMPVYIDILPSMGHLSPFAASTSSANARPSDAARHILDIDPTVTFVSPSPVNGKSSYIVLLDGAPVHSENTSLEYVGPYFSSPTGRSPGNEPTLYNTALVPKYWDVLCKAADPTLYTIIQDVHCVPDPVSSLGYSQRPRPARIFSAIYHFQYRTSADTSSYGQVSVGTSRGSSSMTSAFDGALQGTVAVDFSYARAFPTSPSCTTPVPGATRVPTSEVEQTLFDEPFMLDVNFEQIAFDDFAANMDNTSDSTAPHFSARDPNTFFM